MREWYANKIAKHTQWRITDNVAISRFNYRIEMRVTFPFGLGIWRLQPLPADNHVLSVWHTYTEAHDYLTKKLANNLEGVFVP